MNLEEKLKELPKKPGIYQYFDKNRRLLYVGKAKVLKNRVKSYFHFTPKLSPASNLSPRIYKMISEVEDLEYIVVDNEHDALILENSLIKQLKPKYNILLRDDKTYPYIYIDMSENFPRFEITRKVIKKSHIKYYGPFSSGAKDILDSIYEIFPLVQRKNCLKEKKKCLFYQINRCLAPCEGLVTKEDYKKIVKKANNLIFNNTKLIKELEQRMLQYSNNLQFEEAGVLRDRIQKIKNINFSTTDLAKLEDIDIFAIHIDNDMAIGIKIFVRSGKVISSDYHIFKNEYGFDKNELYKTIFLNHYQDEVPYLPKEILILEDFEDKKEIEKFILNIYKKKILIKIPQKGTKKRLVELALSNAKEIVRIQKGKDDKVLYQIKELFNLQRVPYNIEGYDNSHMMGYAKVGSIVYWEDKFIKKNYRHYNLNSKDEYSQMKELIQRRLDDLKTKPLPNLLVIDGGKTLLNLVIKLVKQKGVFVDIIAIAKEKRNNKVQRAKGRTRDIIYTKDGEFKLDVNDKRLHFIQNIRDEAHRFAINFHKKQKLKEDKKLSLLKKRGIGEITIKKLIQYFGNFQNIQNAKEDELAKVIGIKKAKLIKE